MDEEQQNSKASQQQLLKQRAARLASRPTAVRQRQAEVLVVSLHHDRWALTLAQVERLLRPAGLRPLPKVPASVVGILHHQGKVLTVLDLAILLGRGPTEQLAESKILVVAAPNTNASAGEPVAEAGQQVGLLVRQVLGVETPDTPLRPPLVAQIGVAGHWNDLALIDLPALLLHQAQLFGAKT
jgi:chemotaxis signal transduction protein